MKEFFSPFYSSESTLEKWDFNAPKGTILKNKGGYWNWSDKKTPTTKTGPKSGHSHGYVYIESSSPTKAGDIFTMTTKDTFNAKESEIEVSYWYNCNTIVPVQVQVQGWNGFQWMQEDSFLPLMDELEDRWIQRKFKIENYNTNDCKVRFKIIIPESAKTHRTDFAFDTITISTSEPDTDNINDYFVSKDIYKRKKFDLKFLGKHKVKEDFDNILQEFKNNINDFDFTKYPNGVLIEESQQIVHLFTEKDKDN